MQMHSLLITASSREHSNSRLLAHRVLAEMEYRTSDLRQQHIADVVDHRFDATWPVVKDDFTKIMRMWEEADIIVLASPVYWYSVSARLSRFIERWSECLRHDSQFRKQMRTKLLALFLVGGDNPRVQGRIIVQQFRYIANFSGINFAGYVIGRADRPGSIEADQDAVAQADHLNRQLRAMSKLSRKDGSEHD